MQGQFFENLAQLSTQGVNWIAAESGTCLKSWGDSVWCSVDVDKVLNHVYMHVCVVAARMVVNILLTRSWASAREMVEAQLWTRS